MEVGSDRDDRSRRAGRRVTLAVAEVGLDEIEHGRRSCDRREPFSGVGQEPVLIGGQLDVGDLGIAGLFTHSRGDSVC